MAALRCSRIIMGRMFERERKGLFSAADSFIQNHHMYILDSGPYYS